jgi:hypothetical protein
MLFHGFSEEFRCGLAIATLYNEAFESLPFMIDCAPKVVLLSIYFHEHFIQMPLPIRMRTKLLNPFSLNIRSEHRTKSIPPEPHRFVADIDATFMQKIFDIAKLKREPDIHHHRQADDLGGRLEVAKG